MRLAVFLLVLVWPVWALAGPWPRAAGETFVSVAAIGRSGSVWVERGLQHGRWLVFDGRIGRDGDWEGAVRLHRAMQDRGAWKLAWSLGLSVGMPQRDIVIDLPPVWWPGKTEVTVRLEPLVTAQAGLSLGRGLDRPWPGWLALDLTADVAGGGWSRLRADATLGFRPAPRWMAMMQVHVAAGRGKPQVTLAPSVVWQASKALSLQAGLHHDLRGRRTVARLGSWMTF
jgi:hypothetical protein